MAKRITVNLTKRGEEGAAYAVSSGAVSNTADALNKGAEFYGAALKHKDRGGKVVFIHPDGTHEVIVFV